MESLNITSHGFQKKRFICWMLRLQTHTSPLHSSRFGFYKRKLHPILLLGWCPKQIKRKALIPQIDSWFLSHHNRAFSFSVFDMLFPCLKNVKISSTHWKIKCYYQYKLFYSFHKKFYLKNILSLGRAKHANTGRWIFFNIADFAGWDRITDVFMFLIFQR